MKKIIGICNLHDDPHLGLLTESRPCGAVTFLGRYGLIDFTLSNFSNSGIEKVYVLVKSGILQMRNHIGNGSIWTNNTKTGFIKLLINEKGLFSPKFNTDIANIKLNLPIDEIDFEYAVIAPSFMLASIDYGPIVKEHIESKADITIVYSHLESTDEEFINCDRLRVNKDNRVTKIDTNFGKTREADISLESFVITKKALIKILAENPKVSEMYNLRQMINYYVNEYVLNIRAYKFEGYVVPMLDFDHYVRNSFEQLNYDSRRRLFLEDWPIYTTTHNTPPTLYSKTADVQNSFIANGSVIKGKVENSIISREVLVEKGAVIKNSIIFTKSEIGRDVKLEYVVTDKKVKINTTKELSGTEDKPLYIHQGAKI